jgi:hypothetical protein
MLHSNYGCRAELNAQTRPKVHGRNVCFVEGLLTGALKGLAMDNEPKRVEPEITPPVPETEPGRSVPEIPPDKDALEKNGPLRGEN